MYGVALLWYVVVRVATTVVVMVVIVGESMSWFLLNIKAVHHSNLFTTHKWFVPDMCIVCTVAPVVVADVVVVATAIASDADDYTSQWHILSKSFNDI